jgi:hypothetical protein
MLLFRSEEHVDGWIEQTGRSRGATMTVDQLWDLATRWYAGRLVRGWQRPTPEEAEAIFAAVGLSGDFWRMTDG